jgi:uncharacterized membrane protein
MNTILRQFKRPLLYLMGPAYIVAGALHFVVPELYVQIVPPIFPAALTLVYLSGLAEIAVGIGLLIPRTRRHAAWATVVLLVAIFPANVYMSARRWRSVRDCSLGTTPTTGRVDSLRTLVHSPIE